MSSKIPLELEEEIDLVDSVYAKMGAGVPEEARNDPATIAAMLQTAVGTIIAWRLKRIEDRLAAMCDGDTAPY